MPLGEKPPAPPRGVNRRTMLKLSAAGAALVGASPVGRASVAAAPRSKASPEGEALLRDGDQSFRVEIDGAPLADVETLSMEDLSIDVREIGEPADWDYRVYGPGDAHYGSITIRSRVGKDSRELYQWWLDTSRGKNIRKNISVICLKRDGSEARRFDLFECFPTSWDPGEYSPSSNVAVETIVCKMGRVELA